MHNESLDQCSKPSGILKFLGGIKIEYWLETA